MASRADSVQADQKNTCCSSCCDNEALKALAVAVATIAGFILVFTGIGRLGPYPFEIKAMVLIAAGVTLLLPLLIIGTISTCTFCGCCDCRSS